MTLPYLYEHQNPHAPVRSNGLRFHGHPGRVVRPRLIGVHTTESLFDRIGADTGAEGVARYQASTDRPSSYHRIVDRDSTVVCLPDQATAFGIGNLNGPTLHLSFALRATDWADPGKARDAVPMLRRGAAVVADWHRAYGIPLTRLTRAQAFGLHSGLIAHGVADPDRRSDPGTFFPWLDFLGLVQAELAGATPTPAPPTSPPTAQPAPRTAQEDDMARLIRSNGPGKKVAIIGAPGRPPFDHITDPELAASLARAHGDGQEVNPREFDRLAEFYGSPVRSGA